MNNFQYCQHLDILDIIGNPAHVLMTYMVVYLDETKRDVEPKKGGDCVIIGKVSFGPR